MGTYVSFSGISEVLLMFFQCLWIRLCLSRICIKLGFKSLEMEPRVCSMCSTSSPEIIFRRALSQSFSPGPLQGCAAGAPGAAGRALWAQGFAGEATRCHGCVSLPTVPRDSLLPSLCRILAMDDEDKQKHRTGTAKKETQGFVCLLEGVLDQFFQFVAICRQSENRSS